MKLPTSVRIGFKDYSIKPYPEDAQRENGNWGHCKHGPAEMFVHNTEDGRETANTLLHEILHACCHVGATEMPRDQEEKTVNIFANQLSGVFRDNPELIKWLAKNLE